MTSRLYGYPRPKQFCAFGQQQTLLESTLSRAARFVDADRIVVMISRHHWREVREPLLDWPMVTVIDQPANRDTLPGILWPTLHIHAMDPEATVVVLPSDHHVGPAGSGEAAFADAVCSAATEVERQRDDLVLLGAEVDGFEDDLGWIVPKRRDGARYAGVSTFSEKPPRGEIDLLRRRGALANTFVMVGRAERVSMLVRRHRPDWWHALAASFTNRHLLGLVYRDLPSSSFSRDVLSAALDSLRVVPMNGVHWSDIGKPERLERVLVRRLGELQPTVAGGGSWPALDGAEGEEQMA